MACAVKRTDVNVDWYRGEQALFTGSQAENHKYKRIDDGLQRELIVKNVSPDDQGDYVCQADKYRVTLHLNVQGLWNCMSSFEHKEICAIYRTRR